MKAGGRAAVILVPACDGRGPSNRAGLVAPGNGIPHSDGTLHSDGTGYAQSYSGATLTDAVPMNATQIRISLAVGLRLLPGMRFSMSGGRLHEIADLVAWDGAGIWTVRIGPWTAAAWPAGTALEFEKPVCRMRLASDESGALSLSLNRFATPTIEFVEAF
ncbi:hypothetical protein ASG40_11685 [Methylobacterium sp. Leaf399]|nr:hypothetical protein ASG40_11685 [Methylobacterium sp. Leaf399]